ncbi:MAG: hypothetical protein NVS9B9_15290 [Ktedonobacteraceae bacterium]
MLEQQLLSSVAGSHTEFFSKEELAETVREIGSVDTDSDTSAIQDAALYSNVPAATHTDTGTDGQADYNTVPDSKPTVNRS